MSGSRTRALAALAALAALLAGCAGIPTGGPVGTVGIGTDAGGGELVTLAEGPQPGDTPDRLLTGFLIAQRAPQQNYSVAREFLTSDFRATWSPTARVLISDTPIVVQGAPEQEVLGVTVSVTAYVDASGVYTELPQPEIQELPYTFELNADGEPISSLSLLRGQHGLKRSVPQAEGLTSDDEGNLYLVSEPNLFYVFKKKAE